jgi:hypothetical protein
MNLCVEPLSHVVVQVEIDPSDRKIRSFVVAGKRGCPGFVDGGAGVGLLNNPTCVVLSDDGTCAIVVDSGNR